jgi:hypothetical protein
VLFDKKALRIAAHLGIAHAHEDVRCLVCHTNPLAAAPQVPERLRLEKTLGVGCEACHGEAEQWIEQHTASDWKHENRASHRMVEVDSPLALAERCVGCHVGAPPAKALAVAQDVNHDLIAAGHPRLNFEFSSFLANIPPHWKPKRVDEAQRWAVGQAVCARAALDLLVHRSKTVSWPEFAEYDCFACHHDLKEPSWRQKRGYPGRLPGALPWSDWYMAMPRLMAPSDSLEELRRKLETPLPQPEDVARVAGGLADHFKAFQGGLSKDFDAKKMRSVLLKPAETYKDPKAASSSWDAGEQLYLALWALNADVSNPALGKALQTIDNKSRGLQGGFDSPVLFHPDRFFPELTQAVKLLSDAPRKEK